MHAFQALQSPFRTHGRLIAWALALFFVGWLSTGSVGHPLWMLPALRVLALARSRWSASVGAGMLHLGGYHDVPLSPAGFFPALDALQAGVLGVLAWASISAVATLPYAITWCGHRWPGVWLMLASVLTTLPPLGWLTPINPLHVAGWLFPGLGFLGVALTLCTVAAVPSLPLAAARSAKLHLALPALLGIGCWANLVFHSPSPPPGWIAHDAALGAYVDSADNAWKRSEAIATLVERHVQSRPQASPAGSAGSSAIVLPEYAAGIWREGTAQLMQSAFGARGLLRPGMLVLFGAELPQRNGPINALMVLQPDGALSYLRSRITLPLVNWHAGTGGFESQPWSVPHLRVDHVGQVTVGFCWEDLLPWMHYQAMWLRPAAHVSVASLWWAKGTHIERNLRLYVDGLQQLFGVPVLLSVNVAAGP